MKKGYKKLLSAVFCCAVFLLMFTAVSRFFMRKTSYIKNADFYSYEGDFDVLFLGSSHMVMGISPMELWKEYGITSYNLANHGQWIPVDYWALKNALQYTTPKAVVLDVRAIDIDNNKYSPEHISQLHELFDAMPFGKMKIDAVKDLLPKDKWMEYLFNFSIYHTRWNEIDESFFGKAKPSPEKGAMLDNADHYDEATVEEIDPPVLIEKDEMYLQETTGKEYLRKIIELCQENEIEIILTALPYSPSDMYQRWLNSAAVIAEKYGAPYLDYNVEDTFVNFHTDYFDDAHLNSSGNRKATFVLGKYLAEECGLGNSHDEKTASVWDKDYKKYMKFKLNWLKQQDSLNSYLMLLCDKQFDIVVDIYNPDIWKDPSYVYLFENLGVSMDQVTEDTDCIVIKKGGESAEALRGFHGSEGVVETSVGQLGLFIEDMDEKGNVVSYGVYVDEKKRYSVPADEPADMRILVLKDENLKTCDFAAFSYTVEKQKKYKLTTTAVKR